MCTFWSSFPVLTSTITKPNIRRKTNPNVLYPKAFLQISYAPVNSSCAHPPPGNCGAFARIVSPGDRALAGALAYPRATPGLLTHVVQTKTILSEKTSSLSLIGLSVKDWTKLWRFLKVCFLDFRHFLIVYQATTLKRDREKSL